jgi:hypothetical protein
MDCNSYVPFGMLFHFPFLNKFNKSDQCSCKDLGACIQKVSGIEYWILVQPCLLDNLTI